MKEYGCYTCGWRGSSLRNLIAHLRYHDIEVKIPESVFENLEKASGLRGMR